MKNSNTLPAVFSLSAPRWTAAFLTLGCITSVHALPAQNSLLTASAPPKPNVVLTLDDSGSMTYYMMPDTVGGLQFYNVTPATTSTTTQVIGTRYTKKSFYLFTPTKCTNYFSGKPNSVDVPPGEAPTTSNNIRRDCYDASDITQQIITTTPASATPTGGRIQVRPLIYPGDINVANGNGGVVDTNAIGFNGAPNDFGARFRSSDVNGNYYNPATTYLPWPAAIRNIAAGQVDSNGYPSAPYTAVPLDPTGTNTGTADLVTAQSNAASNNVRWCAEGIQWNLYGNGNQSNRCQIAQRLFEPAVYYVRRSDAPNIAAENLTAANFDRININAQTTFTKAPTRTDCAGTTCTYAEEMKNFATWFTYYRNRIFAAKGAVALAFDAQPSEKFRLGWGSINNGSTTTDGYTNNTLSQGVRSFSDGHKTNLFNWLRALNADGATPLRTALNDIGQYFSASGATSTADPYRVDPTNTNQTPLACRRNFSIFVTDGYWNRNSAVPANTNNQDGTSSTTDIQNDLAESTFSYRYTAKAPFTDNYLNTLADVAMRYWKTDLRGDLKNIIPVSDAAQATPDNYQQNPAYWQHLVNFTVGFGVDGSQPSTDAQGNDVDLSTDTWTWPDVQGDTNTTIDDLWHAAVNSRGRYLKATDPIAFANSLSGILSKITSTGGTVSGVAISNTYIAENTLKLIPSYEPERWSGELQGVDINISTTGAATTTPSWNASAVVPAYDKRNIWTKFGGETVAFTTDSFSSAESDALGYIRSGVAPTALSSLINYLRGDTSQEGDAADKPYRPRLKVGAAPDDYTNVLGSFVNSLPVYVKSANFGNVFLPSTVNSKSTGSEIYNKYLVDKRARSGLVLIGGNDGMLHGFRATDGVEMFAYIPQTVLKGESHPLTTADNWYGLARLANKGYSSSFFMDGQITEADISSCATECAWKNIAVASAGGGAKSVFALDITNNFAADTAAEPKVFKAGNVMWEIDQNISDDLGYVMAAPQVGLLPSGEWAVIFGNGFDSKSGKAVLFIVKASDGSLLETIAVDDKTGNGLGGVRLVRDSDNKVVQAYAGDLKGNVWKFDLSGATSSDWKVDFGGKPLFAAGDSKPITAAPNFKIHPKKGVMVFVSTGSLYSDSDTSKKTQQTIYGLWDKAELGIASKSGTTIVPLDLKTQVIQSPEAGSTGNTQKFKIIEGEGVSTSTNSLGWKLDMLFSDGERGIYSPQFLQDYVFVETVQPGAASQESCEIAQGSGYGYLLDPFTGAQPTTPILDLNMTEGVEGAGSGDDYGVFKRNSVGQSATQIGNPGRIYSDDGSAKTKGATAPVDRSWRQIFWEKF